MDKEDISAQSSGTRPENDPQNARTNIKKTASFIGLSFLFSWTMAALFFAFGGRWNTTAGVAMAGCYMFTPMLAAIIVQKLIYREPIKKPFGISFRLNRWFLVAWLLPVIMAFATLGVGLLFPAVGYSPGMEGMFERFKSVLTPEQLEQLEKQAKAFPLPPIWIALLSGLVAGITVNAVAGFGEEVGWRGFLQHEFARMGFWKSSALIGIVWGIWHTPLILAGHNYPQHPVIGVAMMTILCILLAPIFSYIRIKGRSVIAAAIIHGSLNGTAGLSIMLLKGGNDLLIGVTGLGGFIVLGIVNLCFFGYDRFLAKEPVAILLAPRRKGVYARC